MKAYSRWLSSVKIRHDRLTIVGLFKLEIFEFFVLHGSRLKAMGPKFLFFFGGGVDSQNVGVHRLHPKRHILAP